MVGSARASKHRHRCGNGSLAAVHVPLTDRRQSSSPRKSRVLRPPRTTPSGPRTASSGAGQPSGFRPGPDEPSGVRATPPGAGGSCPAPPDDAVRAPESVVRGRTAVRFSSWAGRVFRGPSHSSRGRRTLPGTPDDAFGPRAAFVRGPDDAVRGPKSAIFSKNGCNGPGAMAIKAPGRRPPGGTDSVLRPPESCPPPPRRTLSGRTAVRFSSGLSRCASGLWPWRPSPSGCFRPSLRVRYTHFWKILRMLDPGRRRPGGPEDTRTSG